MQIAYDQQILQRKRRPSIRYTNTYFSSQQATDDRQVQTGSATLDALAAA